MKKIVTIALATLLAASLLAPASAAQPEPQVVEGSILLPGLFPQGIPSGNDGCWGGGTRRITQTAGGQGSGLIGYRFPVDKATWNGKFKLEVTGGVGTVDLDLFLYSVMPPAEAAIDDPVNGGSPVSQDWTTREEGGEVGKVPPKTTDAIVCMYGGPSGYAGFNATFKYTATPPVKKKKNKKK